MFYNTNNAADVAAVEQLTALNIPCVGFSTSLGDCNTVETFNTWATLIGEVLGKEVRAQEIVDDAMAREREMRVGAEDYADQIFARASSPTRKNPPR